jgi:quinol-cytochrome oxidoreductase complex cytochrome b subunit
LALEILTGFLLTLVYVPDAGRAYGIVHDLIAAPGWSIVVNFHFYNAFLIVGLVMIHVVPVFVTVGTVEARRASG